MIRSRISSTIPHDNVITVSPVARVDLNDARGTVDPKSNPYENSVLDTMHVPQEIARVVGCTIALECSDGIGVPSNMPVRDLLSFARMMNNPGDNIEYTYRQRLRSPLTAVRAFCIECKGGSPKAVTQCSAVECPFWGLRMGKNAHYGKRG
jgi:predicted aldo/keto reductase-like oxidoreductase